MEEDNSEKEDLCDQLSRQNEALYQMRQEIREWEKAKSEYQEIVIQMQKRGIFLGSSVHYDSVFHTIKM